MKYVQKRTSLSAVLYITFWLMGTWLAYGNLNFRRVPLFPPKSVSLCQKCLYNIVYAEHLSFWDSGICQAKGAHVTSPK